MEANDFGRPDRDDNRMSFASVGESFKTSVGNGARTVAARLGRSRKTLIRTLPIMDQCVAAL